jgi:hypothetical protein
VYGGSRASAYQPTIYEKGLQLGSDYPANLVRLEHRFTFSKAADKQALSVLTPVQMVGLRPVSRDLARDLMGLCVAPYHIDKLPKETSSYHWMLRQFRRTFHELRTDHGSWAAAGEQIGLDLVEIEQELH